MPTIAAALLGLITNAPAEIDAIKAIYSFVKGSLSDTEVADIDAALQQAQDSDAAATARADAAGAEAAKRS